MICCIIYSMILLHYIPPKAPPHPTPPTPALGGYIMLQIMLYIMQQIMLCIMLYVLDNHLIYSTETFISKCLDYLYFF